MLLAEHGQHFVGIDGHQHLADIGVDQIAHQAILQMRGDFGIARGGHHDQIVHPGIVKERSKRRHLLRGNQTREPGTSRPVLL
jgi:hypothetical protein